MDIISLRRRIETIIHRPSSELIPGILGSGLSCIRCGWCCRENFMINITQGIQRPSNAISIFPDDIKRIMKGTGKLWDEVAQPDIYSCLSEGESILAIGWILRRNDEKDCTFYRKNECSIYRWRPMICRCYPFFMGSQEIDVMHCDRGQGKIPEEGAAGIAKMMKRYEIKKLQSYIRIISQLGERLKMANLRSLPQDFAGEILVYDGEMISKRQIKYPGA